MSMDLDSTLTENKISYLHRTFPNKFMRSRSSILCYLFYIIRNHVCLCRSTIDIIAHFGKNVCALCMKQLSVDLVLLLKNGVRVS